MYKCRSSLNFIWLLVILITFGSSVRAQDETIQLATMNWLPVYGESLPNGGVFTELTTEAFHRAGYYCDVKFVPWKRALTQAKKGAFGGLMGAVLNEERKSDFVATDPIMLYEEFLFSRADSQIQYRDYSDLKAYNIGSIAGVAINSSLVAAGLKVEEIVRTEQNLDKLIRGRIDLLVADSLSIANIIKARPEFAGALRQLTKPLQTSPLPNLISKKRTDYKIIVEKFNKSLKAMRDDGTFDKIAAKHGFHNLR